VDLLAGVRPGRDQEGCVPGADARDQPQHHQQQNRRDREPGDPGGEQGAHAALPRQPLAGDAERVGAGDRGRRQPQRHQQPLPVRLPPAHAAGQLVGQHVRLQDQELLHLAARGQRPRHLDPRFGLDRTVLGQDDQGHLGRQHRLRLIATLWPTVSATCDTPVDVLG
jgi:hypothetical protein